MRKFLWLFTYFILISAQQEWNESPIRRYELRQYFITKPTRRMQFVLESTQRIEKEIQNLCKIFKEIFKELPDTFLYTPHSFTQNIFWRDIEKALLKAESHLNEIRLFVNDIADRYESYEHPAVSVYNYNEKLWLKEIWKLLDDIKIYQEKGIPERERPKGYYYQPLPLSSSIYHPSVFYVLQRRQAQRPVQSGVIEADQGLSKLD